MPTSSPETNLAQLRDVHLPDPLSIWPPAPGWFLLAALIIGGMLGIVYIIYRHWKKQTPKRQALKQLNELAFRYQQNKQAALIIPELSILLRRLALAYFPRIETAGLCGNEWLTFLNTTGNTSAFTDKISTILTDAPYQKEPSQELSETFIICRQWIKSIGNYSENISPN